MIQLEVIDSLLNNLNILNKMSIITRICPTGPMKSRECLAFFGVEYQTYLWLILFSLIIGFVSVYIYSKLRKMEYNQKSVLISFLISLIVFILLSILKIWNYSQRIY